jgi:hypothetical protein
VRSCWPVRLNRRRAISLRTDDEAVAIQKARASDAGATIRRIQNIDLRIGRGDGANAWKNLGMAEIVALGSNLQKPKDP